MPRKLENEHAIPLDPNAPPAPVNLSRAVRLLAERAFYVDPAQLDRYEPLETDLRICEAMLGGAINVDAIARTAHLRADDVRERLNDALVCAWISRHVHSQIQYRLGLVDAAMLHRALGGDVKAAALLYQRYGHLAQKSMHINANLDLTRLDDADLNALLDNAARLAARGKGTADPGGGRDGAPEAGGAIALLEAPSGPAERERAEEDT